MKIHERLPIIALCAIVALIALSGPLVGIVQKFHLDPNVVGIGVAFFAGLCILFLMVRKRVQFSAGHVAGSIAARIRAGITSLEDGDGEFYEDDEQAGYPALPASGYAPAALPPAYTPSASSMVQARNASTTLQEETQPLTHEPVLALSPSCPLPLSSARHHSLILEQPGTGRRGRSHATRLFLESFGAIGSYTHLPLIAITTTASYAGLLPCLSNAWLAGSTQGREGRMHLLQFVTQQTQATGMLTVAGSTLRSATLEAAKANQFVDQVLQEGAQVIVDLSSYADMRSAAQVLLSVLGVLRQRDQDCLLVLTDANRWLPNDRWLAVPGHSMVADASLVAALREGVADLLTRQATSVYLSTNGLMNMDLRLARACALWTLNMLPAEEDREFISYHTAIPFTDLDVLAAHSILADVTSRTAMEMVLTPHRSFDLVGSGRSPGQPSGASEPITDELLDARDEWQEEEETRLGKSTAEGGDADEEEDVATEEMPPSADARSAGRKPFTRQQLVYAVALLRDGQLTQTALKRPPTTKTVSGTPVTFADLAQELGLKQQWSDKDMLWNERAHALYELVNDLSAEERSDYEGDADLALSNLLDRLRFRAEVSASSQGPSSRWELPDIGLLHAPDPVKNDVWQEVAAKARLLQETLNGFGVATQVLEEYINIGPRVIRFGILPTGTGDKRTKVEHITRLKKDLQRILQAKTIRILDPVPGTPYVGIEIPNPVPSTVRLRDILEDRDYMRARARSRLTLALGRDVTGKVRFFDLRKAPHVLIGGTTGSGKSVCVNTLLGSLLMGATPEDVRLALVDPKKVELPFYNKIPHLLGPVITKMENVAPMLEYALQEMNRRYDVFADLGVRDLDEYNKLRAKNATLPNVPAHVILIDELAAIMLAVIDGVPIKDVVEPLLCDLIALGRAAGVHLILATQRPVVDVVTGNIKAQLPARIGFMVPQLNDSRIILDQPGAETLLGKGDMLFLNEDTAVAERIQCAWTETDEAQAITSYWKQAQPLTASSVATPIDAEHLRQMTLTEQQQGPWTKPSEETSSEDPSAHDAREEQENAGDPLLDRAIVFVRESGSASISRLQRQFHIGYGRAANLIEQMEHCGIIGPAVTGGKPREVLVSASEQEEDAETAEGAEPDSSGDAPEAETSENELASVAPR